MMRILLVVPEYEPISTGGGPVYYQALKQSYDAAGHQTHVLSGSPTSRIVGPRPDVTYFPLVPSAWTKRLHVKMPDVRSYMPPRPLSLSNLMSALDEPYDVYHLFGYGFTMVDLVARYLWARRKRFGFTVMGAPYSPSEMGGAIKAIYGTYEALCGTPTLRLATRIHAISHFAGANESFAAFRDKIDVIHLGTSTTRTPERLPENPPPLPFVLSIGRVQWSKGFQIAIDAIAALERSGDGIDYVILGPDANYRAYLEGYAAARGVARRVRFVGTVDEAEKEWYIERASLFLIPSLFEPFGLVSLEAMIRGKIVIASATGGLAETINDGRDGFLVPPSDPQALATAIRARLGPDYTAVASEARAHGERRSWKRVANDHLTWYHDRSLINK